MKVCAEDKHSLCPQEVTHHDWSAKYCLRDSRQSALRPYNSEACFTKPDLWVSNITLEGSGHHKISHLVQLFWTEMSRANDSLMAGKYTSAKFPRLVQLKWIKQAQIHAVTLLKPCRMVYSQSRYKSLAPSPYTCAGLAGLGLTRRVTTAQRGFACPLEQGCPLKGVLNEDMLVWVKRLWNGG